jgi:hypothetical protein
VKNYLCVKDDESIDNVIKKLCEGHKKLRKAIRINYYDIRRCIENRYFRKIFFEQQMYMISELFDGHIVIAKLYVIKLRNYFFNSNDEESGRK